MLEASHGLVWGCKLQSCKQLLFFWQLQTTSYWWLEVRTIAGAYDCIEQKYMSKISIKLAHVYFSITNPFPPGCYRPVWLNFSFLQWILFICVEFFFFLKKFPKSSANLWRIIYTFKQAMVWLSICATMLVQSKLLQKFSLCMLHTSNFIVESILITVTMVNWSRIPLIREGVMVVYLGKKGPSKYLKAESTYMLSCCSRSLQQVLSNMIES